MLRKAGELGLELADDSALQGLGHYWVRIDPPSATEQLTYLLRELRRRASSTPNPEKYRQITQNAQGIGHQLSRLAPSVVEDIFADWPESPSESTDDLMSAEERLRQFQQRQLWDKIQTDLDGALQEMRPLEGEGPFLSLRSQAIGRLLEMGRLEEADALLDETLDLVLQDEPDQESLFAIRNLVSRYGSFGSPDRFEDLLETWAMLENSFEGSGGGVPQVPGIELSSKEFRILNTLQNLHQTPELALHALERFPELKLKLDQFGGLSAYTRAVRQHFLKWRSFGGGVGSAEAARDIQEKMNAISSRFWNVEVADQVVAEIVELAGALSQMRDPQAEANLFSELIRFYFGLQGELSLALRQQGLDYVRELRSLLDPEEVDGEQQRKQRVTRDRLDRLERNIYAMWLWADTVEAEAALRDLPREVQYRAILSYLGNLAQVSLDTWNMH